MSTRHIVRANQRLGLINPGDFAENGPTLHATIAQTEATLALAYEARTANLIALFDMGGENFDSREIKYGTLVTQIAERLGVKK